MEVLVFSVRGEPCALPVADVREILRAVAVTRLPHAPAVVEGIVDVRGEIVPVLDIRERFGLPRSDIHPEEHFILARAGGRPVLLRADRALEVRDVEVDPLTGFAEGEHLAGVARLPDSLAVIYDLETFLSASDSVLLEAALRASPDHAPRHRGG